MSQQATIAVFADFDDTLTTKNVAHLVLNRFAPEALAEFRSQYRAGTITFREYQEKAFDAVTVGSKEMQELAADETELRAGLTDLLKAVDATDGTFTVASAGLDIYIGPVLKRNGLEQISLVCGSAVEIDSGGSGFRYDYPFAEAEDEPCRGDWATCKCKALQQAGDYAVTVFVGDGSTSDACVAEKADYVFARDRLLRICEESGIEATPFEDFSPVTDLVIRLGAEANRQPEQKLQR